MKSTYKGITGTFTIPAPKTPFGDSGTYSSNAWVGIDGELCGNSFLQTGVDFTVSGGSVSYDGAFLLLILLEHLVEFIAL